MTSNHLFWNTSTIYIASAQSAIFMVLRIYHFATANLPNFMYCKSTNYFTTGNRLHNCLLSIEKLYDNFQSPIWKHINDLYCYCSKAQFLATAPLSFSYCASPNYLSTAKSTNYITTGNRLNIWLLCIEKFYDNFTLLTWKHFEDLYRFCAKRNF